MNFFDAERGGKEKFKGFVNFLLRCKTLADWVRFCGVVRSLLSYRHATANRVRIGRCFLRLTPVKAGERSLIP